MKLVIPITTAVAALAVTAGAQDTTMTGCLYKNAATGAYTLVGTK